MSLDTLLTAALDALNDDRASVEPGTLGAYGVTAAYAGGSVPGDSGRPGVSHRPPYIQLTVRPVYVDEHTNAEGRSTEREGIGVNVFAPTMAESIWIAKRVRRVLHGLTHDATADGGRVRADGLYAANGNWLVNVSDVSTETISLFWAQLQFECLVAYMPQED